MKANDTTGILATKSRVASVSAPPAIGELQRIVQRVRIVGFNGILIGEAQ